MGVKADESPGKEEEKGWSGIWMYKPSSSIRELLCELLSEWQRELSSPVGGFCRGTVCLFQLG